LSDAALIFVIDSNGLKLRIGFDKPFLIALVGVESNYLSVAALQGFQKFNAIGIDGQFFDWQFGNCFFELKTILRAESEVGGKFIPLLLADCAITIGCECDATFALTFYENLRSLRKSVQETEIISNTSINPFF
jgi:hypothetical protein